MNYGNFEDRHRKRHSDNIKFGLVICLIGALIYGIVELLKYLGLVQPF